MDFLSGVWDRDEDYGDYGQPRKEEDVDDVEDEEVEAPLTLHEQPPGPVPIDKYGVPKRWDARKGMWRKQEGLCGINGCTLPNNHAGLHNLPDIGRRRKRTLPKACVPVTSTIPTTGRMPPKEIFYPVAPNGL